MTSPSNSELPHTPFNMLLLRTGNSARSILAEAIMNQVGASRFKARSAGSMPKGAVHPRALNLLENLDRLAIKRSMDDIGHTHDAPRPA